MRQIYYDYKLKSVAKNLQKLDPCWKYFNILSAVLTLDTNQSHIISIQLRPVLASTESQPEPGTILRIVQILFQVNNREEALIELVRV